MTICRPSQRALLSAALRETFNADDHEQREGKGYRLCERGTDSAPKLKPSLRTDNRTLMNDAAGLAGYAGSHPHHVEHFRFPKLVHFSVPV
jgi:hypothetical protein